MHDEALKHFRAARESGNSAPHPGRPFPTAASIALIHAGAGNPVRAWSPWRRMCSSSRCASIRSGKRKQAFEKTDLPEKLAVTRDARRTFYGWATSGSIRSSSAGTSARYLLGIRCPVLAIQGRDDEYGPRSSSPRSRGASPAAASSSKLPECGHSPFRDQPEAVLSCVSSFNRKIIS